jgi:hypothetical protein
MQIIFWSNLINLVVKKLELFRSFTLGLFTRNVFPEEGGGVIEVKNVWGGGNPDLSIQMLQDVLREQPFSATELSSIKFNQK